jgi:hypothetical protein
VKITSTSRWKIKSGQSYWDVGYILKAKLANGIKNASNSLREADCVFPVSSGNREFHPETGNKKYPNNPVNPVYFF